MMVLTAIMTISQRFSICKPGSGPLSVLVAVVLGVGDEVVLGSREQREGEERERDCSTNFFSMYISDTVTRLYDNC